VTVRKILIITPILVILFLLQSYFWVPTYEQQSRGNPDRLNEYITASIGDASILNPILSADSASSDINNLVFEGLIDYNEDLRFRGRLAKSWEIYEEAFFYVNEDAPIPRVGKAGAEEVVELLKKVKKGMLPIRADVKTSFDNIREISILPPREFVVTQREKEGKGTEPNEDITIRVKAPTRIKLVLKEVDQFLFQNISKILGEGYFTTFPGEKYVRVHPEVEPSGRVTYINEVLPSAEHNPIIVFHLRPDVRFHDGHSFDAQDVKFTYESIMNPKNLSPRIADYEPVKRVEVIDPLTVRVVYKRLYSPAIGTWGMGILPEHLLNKEALKSEARSRGMDPENFSMRKSRFNRRPVG